MLIYALEDASGERLILNDASKNSIERNTTTLGTDEFSYDNKIVEKSGQDGAVKLGSTRLKSRGLSLSFSRCYSSWEEHRKKENELLSFLQAAKFLVDMSENKKIPIAVDKYSADYDKGGYQLSSDHSISFEALTPFWEHVVPLRVESDLSGGDINTLNVSSNSFLDIPPLITFTALTACPLLQIYVSTTKQGIEIVDPVLGNFGYETLIVDNSKGTAKIGDLDRTQHISASTGFFKIPKGEAQISVIPTADSKIVVSWNVRTYL